VLPGYGIATVPPVSSAADVPALSALTNGTGLPNATLCGLGSYSLGGWCVQCPSGTVTTARGALTIEECGEFVHCCCGQPPASSALLPVLALTPPCLPPAAVVPPGYYLAPGSNMTQCGNTTFREGWVMFSDPKAAACAPCGDGISSEPRDLDVHPLAASGALVRATSASCCECLTELLP
jgi:hypothetical protein